MKKLEINMGKRMRALRREMALTQEELGAKVGLEKNTISSYETGMRMPTAYIAAKLAKALHVSLDYLCGFTDEKYNILVPDDVELDLSRLNPEGIKMLCEYYRFLCGNDKYLDKKS